MAGTSLPTVSAKITADAAQFVSEFKRAENQTSLSSAKIDAEVGEMQRRVARRFSLGHAATDILHGMGVGSGFALAEKAVDGLAQHWKSAGDAAKEVEKIVEGMAASNKSTAEERLSDPQRLALMDLNLARLAKRKKADDEQVIANASGGERLGLGRNSQAAEWVRGLFTNRRDEKTPEQELASVNLNKEITDLANAREGLMRKQDSAFGGASSELGDKLRSGWIQAEVSRKEKEALAVAKEGVRELKSLHETMQRAMGQSGSTANLH